MGMTKGLLIPASITEEERVALYGAMLSMSAADGHVDKEEVELIYGSLDLDGLSEANKQKVYGYVVEPPFLKDILPSFSGSDEIVRFGVLMAIADIAYTDGVIEDGERQALEFARSQLGATSEQLDAILAFAKTAQAVRERGLDDNVAVDMLKKAAGGLGAVGVPLAIVYFSGAVVGLSAAGVTSGLAALGLGLGMVPGIGVAILLGTAIYVTASWVLDSGGKRAKRKLAKERERRAQLVIKNLNQTIEALVERVSELTEKAALADASREAIARLKERLTTLQRLLRQKLATT